MTRARKIVFYMVLLSLPFLILALVEIGLRLGGYGTEYPLFVPAEINKDYKQPNPQVIKRFFSAPSLAPNVSPDTVFFKADKPKDTYRVMIQGGSTAAGFPYGRWGSPTGMLTQRFKRLYPDKNIEVINTAMAAVNSYTLLDFVDEVIAEKPDVVLIYAGHNEYLGVMGVGSAFAAKGGRGATLLYLKLKNLKIYRLIEQIYVALMSADKVAEKDNRTLMSKVAKEKDIPFNSPLYKAGLEQFEGNINLIIQKYLAAGIPVMIGTLASNEKDQIPFSAIDVPENELRPDVSGNALTNLMTKYQALVEENPTKSQYFYTLGYLYERNGEFEAARDNYLKAKDYDLLRFRAPEAFNDIIRRAAAANGAELVDVQEKIRLDTPNGIIGNGHMLEHLHPNLRGYFMLGEAFIEHLANSEALGAAAPVLPNSAWQDQPVVMVDKLYGEFKVEQLKADYPFTSTPKQVVIPKGSPSENQALYKRIRGADWLTVNKLMLEEYQKEQKFPEAAKTAALMSDAFLFDTTTAFIAGQLYTKSNDFVMAAYYLNRALEFDPSNVNFMLSGAHYNFLAQNYDKSLALLAAAKKLQPDNQKITLFEQRVTQAKNSRK